MSASEIDFKVLKDEDGTVKGLSAVAHSNSPAAIFCKTFPQALKNDVARIYFEDGQIVFHNPSAVNHPHCAFRLDDVNFDALQQLIHGGKEKLTTRVANEKHSFRIVGASN